MTVIQYRGKSEQDLRPKLGRNTEVQSKTDALVTLSNPQDAVAQSLTSFCPTFQVLPSEDDVFTSYPFMKLMHGQERASVSPGVSRGQVSEKCFLALSTAFFGAEHKQATLVRLGFHRYGAALVEVKSALGDSMQCHSYDLLESVVIMALIEVSRASIGQCLEIKYQVFVLNNTTVPGIDQSRRMDPPLTRIGTLDGTSRPQILFISTSVSYPRTLKSFGHFGSTSHTQNNHLLEARVETCTMENTSRKEKRIT
jgi:hypothetical protein